MSEAAGKATDDAAETIIELVESIPPGYLLLAVFCGVVIGVAVMVAISKPPTAE